MKLLCTLPNASTNIDGVRLEPHPRGMVTVDHVDDGNITKRWLSIPGYEVINDEPGHEARDGTTIAPKLRNSKTKGNE